MPELELAFTGDTCNLLPLETLIRSVGRVLGGDFGDVSFLESQLNASRLANRKGTIEAVFEDWSRSKVFTLYLVFVDKSSAQVNVEISC